MKTPLSLMARRPSSPEEVAALADIGALMAVAWSQPGERLVAGWSDGLWGHDLSACLREARFDPADCHTVDQHLEVLSAATARADPITVTDDLAAEYAALFQGPGRALVPAYECQWTDSDQATLFIAPTTAAVESAYRAAGLEVGSREPADSMSCEWEFVGLLARRESQSTGPAAAVWRSQRLEFVAEHLAGWAAPFARAVESATEQGVYAALARITARIGSSSRLMR